MHKEKYIIERKGKKGTTLQVFIPYSSNGEKATFTKSIKVNDFSSPKVAMQYAIKIRDNALTDISCGRLQAHMMTVKQLYNIKWKLFPMSLNTHEKQDAIYKQSIVAYENKQIHDITPADIQICLNKYAENHSSDGVQRLLTIWRQIYKAALFCGYNIPDQTNVIKLPRSKVVNHRNPVDITKDQFEKYLDFLKKYNCKNGTPHINETVYYMLVIMYYTGMRPAEVLALTANDIDDNYISVSKAVGSTATQKCVIVPTKTESSRRRIPVASGLLPYLHNLKKWSKNKYLLSDENGKLYDIDKISNFIRHVSRKCGIPFNAYRLRHLMATDLIRENVDTRTAQEILGHTSFSTTLGYAFSDDKHKKDALENRDE